MESQYKSNASGRNATFTSSFESGTQQAAELGINQNQNNKKSSSSHMVSNKKLHKGKPDIFGGQQLHKG